VLAFGAILAVVKLRQSQVQPPPTNTQASVTTPDSSAPKTAEVGSTQNQQVALNEGGSVAPSSRPVVKPTGPRRTSAAPKTEAVSNHVKLIPGERSYLQAIARLDSTIKSNKTSMRPSLQVEYERNLAVVDRAIAATRNAAKSNPSDPDAADFMFAAYQSKVDLLNTIADARLSGGRSH
jgi:hypothetical protein